VNDRNETEFRKISEVALRVNPDPDDIAKAPEHEFFADQAGLILDVRCPKLGCGAIYAIGFSRVYRTKRSFDDLRGQLLITLEQDHAANRKHPAAITLPPPDAAR